MSMPIADDKMGTLGRPPEDPTPPADICGQARGEDFDTLLPWHVDAVWSQTERSGGEWLFCQIASPKGSARLLPVPHHSEFVGHPRLLLSARGSRLVWEFPDHVRHRSPKASPPRRCANPGQQGPETPPIQSEWHRVAGGVLSMPQPQSHSSLL